MRMQHCLDAMGRKEDEELGNCDLRSWSTDTTLATSGGEQGPKGENDGSEQQSAWTFNARFICRYMAIIIILLGIGLLVGVAIAFVAIPVITSSQSQSDRNNKTNQESSNLPNRQIDPLWTPVCDLQVTKDPTDNLNKLYDKMGTCDATQIRNGTDGAAAGWEDLQPTVESSESIGIFPHLQTEDAFLSISPGFELRSDFSWTLSFSGARVGDDSTFDIIFGPSGSCECQIRYETGNTIGISIAGLDWHGIQLPKSVFQFHVLTLTHHEDDGKLRIYQNAKFVMELDFDHAWAELGDVGSSYNGRYPSFIAIRRIAYFDHPVDSEEVGIADLVLHMSS